MANNDAKQEIDVSVVIPVYNEKEAVRQCILDIKNRMDALPYKYEMIVVNDGSTDGSMDEISDLDVKIISFSHHRGGGVARVKGMFDANGDVILQTDADGTYPVDNIGEMLKMMETADMVIGARKKEAAESFYFLRVFMKWLAKSIAEILVERKIPDLNSGLRVYKKSIALRYSYLYPRGHSIMSTMTLAFMSEGYRVEFVPIDYRKRIGKSKVHIFSDTYNHFMLIISTLVFFNPLRVLMPIPLLMIAFAIVFTVRDIFRLGLGPLTILLWVLSAMIIMLAIISEQIMRLARYFAYLSHDRHPDDSNQ